MALPNTSIYSTSLEEVPVSVTAPVGINPTGDTVQMAFLAVPPPTQPTSLEYVNAAWQSTSLPYIALCLVGPPPPAQPGLTDWKAAAWQSTSLPYIALASWPGGAATLTQGQWYVWIKITASPEVPVKYCGIPGQLDGGSRGHGRELPSLPDGPHGPSPRHRTAPRARRPPDRAPPGGGDLEARRGLVPVIQGVGQPPQRVMLTHSLTAPAPASADPRSAS